MDCRQELWECAFHGGGQDVNLVGTRTPPHIKARSTQLLQQQYVDHFVEEWLVVKRVPPQWAPSIAVRAVHKCRLEQSQLTIQRAEIKRRPTTRV